MIRLVVIPVLALASVLATATTAIADDWSHSVEHQPAATASIRVIEPEGYRFTVNGRTDSAPAVFAVPNADNYFVMTVTSPSGASWERKIEVKAHRQAVVRVRHAVPPPREAAQPGTSSFIGIMVNTTHQCREEAHRGAIKLEFVLGPERVKAVEVPMKSRVDVELPANTYRARLYLRSGAEWQFSTVKEVSVTKDGWVFEYGCTP
ncbi:MAG: hypothetical protein WKG01_08095 [Kofleriaceae bacterium]